MKLLKSNNKILEIEFNIDEIELLNRVIDVPLHAFGRDELLEKTKIGLDKIESIKRKIQFKDDGKSQILDIIDEDYAILKEIFRISCFIVDPSDMQTMTAYTWDDAVKLQKDMDSIDLLPC